MKWAQYLKITGLVCCSLWQLAHAQPLLQPVVLSLSDNTRFRTPVVPVKINGVSTLMFLSSVQTEPLTLFAHALPTLGIHDDNKERVPLDSVELVERTGRTRLISAVTTARVIRVPNPDAYVGEVSGILGGGLFVIAPVEFDFEKGVVILHDRSLQEVIASEPREWMVLPLKKLGASPNALHNLLTLRFSESVTVDALIAVDVWYSRIPAKLLPQANIEELGPTPVYQFSLSRSYLRGKLLQAKIGQEITLKNLTLDIDPEDTPPLLGTSVFHALRRVIVDMRTGELAVRRSVQDFIVPEDGYTGVWLRRDPTGRILVSAVDPLSPAETAGVVVGDILELLQGVHVSKLSLHQAQQMANGLVGQPVEMKVLRAGKAQELRLSPISWFRGELKGREWELGFYEIGGKSFWLIRRLSDRLRALGLRVGDQVVRIDGADVTNTLASLIWDLRGRQITILRYGESETKTYTIPPDHEIRSDFTKSTNAP